MKFLLNFHYSDYWTDPAKQQKPMSWRHLTTVEQIANQVYEYTRTSLQKFKDAGALPDMVQIGNENVNGMIWPEGRTSGTGSWANFARYIHAGISGAKEVDPNIKIMVHTINERGPDGWVNNLRTNLNNIQSGAADRIDVIGLSYYHSWHGDRDSLTRVINRILNQSHNYKIALAEYASYIREVNDIIKNLPNNRGFGTFFWEPQDQWTGNGRVLLFSTNNAYTVYTPNSTLTSVYPKIVQDYGLTTGLADPFVGIPPVNLNARPAVSVKGRTLDVSPPNNEALMISVIDVRGKVRARFDVNGNGKLLLAKIPAGRYFVDVRGAGVRQTLPVVIR